MTQQIRWGILSTANIARGKVIPAIKDSHNGVVAAVASRTQERADQFAADNDIPTAYGSYQALIDAPDIDAIYIPTPNSEHATWAIRCAQAGKPTLCEKPLASDALEAQTMVDSFVEHKIPFAEAFMYRFHPQTERVKQLVDDGTIGDLMTINATFTFMVRNKTNVRLSSELAGGALMDVGCYCVNVMRYLIGAEPYRVHALADVGDETQVDETLAGVLAFPDGVMGHFDCGLRAYRTHTYDIRGTTGRIRVDEGFVMPDDRETVIHVWRGDDYEQISIPPANSYQLMVEDFADAVLKGRPPRFNAQDGVQNMQVIGHLLASTNRHR